MSINKESVVMHEHGYQLPIKRRKLTLGARLGSIV